MANKNNLGRWIAGGVALGAGIIGALGLLLLVGWLECRKANECIAIYTAPVAVLGGGAVAFLTYRSISRYQDSVRKWDE